MKDPYVLDFTVPGEPHGKGRPRFVRATGRTYTDRKTASYENLVRVAFDSAFPDWVPSEGSIELHLYFYFAPPKSWSKKKKEEALSKRLKKTSKPDLDNIEKAVCDALNGVAWADDSQIFSKWSVKEWAERSEARIVIYVRE